MGGEWPVLDPVVAGAGESGRPVVVLESVVFSRLGLPGPAAGEALERALAAVRSRGAVPAVTAVVDGVPRVGLPEREARAVLRAEVKVASRDLPMAVARALPLGATTVSAALALAHGAGLPVLATGGIGGVHRSPPGSVGARDVSADLEALARHPLLTVCAGAKSFLDLPATMAHLETLGVPVMGLGCDELPAFWWASSGLPVAHRVDSPEEGAAVVRAARRMGLPGGLLLVVPVPGDRALDAGEGARAVEQALDDVERAGLVGPRVTPFVLDRVAALTGGRSVVANLALLERNAEVAAEVAVALAPTGTGPLGEGRPSPAVAPPAQPRSWPST